MKDERRGGWYKNRPVNDRSMPKIEKQLERDADIELQNYVAGRGETLGTVSLPSTASSSAETLEEKGVRIQKLLDSSAWKDKGGTGLGRLRLGGGEPLRPSGIWRSQTSGDKDGEIVG